MSVREALSEACGILADIYDQEVIPDGFTILWDAVCDFVESGRGSEALAALREQAGVEEVASAMSKVAYPATPWRDQPMLVREGYRAMAEIALRALGLEGDCDA